MALFSGTLFQEQTEGGGESVAQPFPSGGGSVSTTSAPAKPAVDIDVDSTVEDLPGDFEPIGGDPVVQKFPGKILPSCAPGFRTTTDAEKAAGAGPCVPIEQPRAPKPPPVLPPAETDASERGEADCVTCGERAPATGTGDNGTRDVSPGDVSERLDEPVIEGDRLREGVILALIGAIIFVLISRTMARRR